MSVIKDPFDPRCVIDKEGLAQALKSFTSSTLTMRLAGITQINNYICLYNDYCQSEGSIGGQIDGEELIEWILENKIIEHIFGPNLHVEVIKQSHIVLNFVVSHVTKEHIDVIWSSCQLKHCSRQVYDILTPLIKNMSTDAVLHLYSLICDLEPKDHSEHTLLLSSCLLKYIWTKSLNLSDPSFSRDPCNPLDDLSLVKSPIFTLLPASPIGRRQGDQSSSSPSMEGSEDDIDDDDYEISVKFKSQAKARVKEMLALESHQTSCGSQSSSDEAMDAKETSSQVSGRIISPSKIQQRSEFEPNLVVSKKESDSEDDEAPSLIGKSAVQKQRLLSSTVKSKTSAFPLQGLSDSDSAVIPLAPGISKLDDGDDESILPHLSKDKSDLPDRPIITNSGDNLLSDDNSNSNSSQVSQSSQKNMADFDGEDSSSYLDIEKLKNFYAPRPLVLKNSAAQKLASIGCIHPVNYHEQLTKFQGDEQMNTELSKFTIENVCKPNQTILWDLLQDDCVALLPDGLSHECEKTLCNLICWIADRRIRMKFIEGCLENLSKNYSVIVSLRLLPKIFISFQQFRGAMDTHSISLWADKERQMLKYFFSNLILYHKKGDDSPSRELYSHTEQIQSRLQFLTFIFSYAGSPENFKLTQEQVDTLWDCIANDKECSDELFSWMLNQVRNRQHHALGLDMLQYILKEKIPTLAPDSFSMVTLEFLQQLFGYVLTQPAIDETADVAIKKLWDIALLAANTDVSMAAIRNLNNFYVHLPSPGLEKEEEFIQQCMGYLKSSASFLESDEEKHLTIIQRALLLLKSHLEAFRCRYSFHLRLFHLAGEVSVASHRDKCTDRGQTVKIICCHPGATSDKTSFELNANNYVGELRAEIHHWMYQCILPKYKLEDGRDVDTHFDGVFRLLSQGQELTHDLDEKTLSELGFKDNQLVYVSIGASRPFRKQRESVYPASLLAPPPKNRLPLISLLQSTYFEQLFSLMQLLGSTKSSTSRAQILSRQVWEIINILPTSPDLMKSFQSLATNEEKSPPQSISHQFNGLLSPSSPQKLIYSVQIVEWLQKTSKNEENGWAQKFIDCVGLQRLFDIFVSGVLQQGESEAWNEWKQDCLASLLHLIYQFGIDSLPKDVRIEKNNAEVSNEVCGKRKRNRKASAEKLLVYQFNSKLLEMLSDTESALRVLMTVLSETASIIPGAVTTNNYRTRFWGRAQVVHNTLQFLISWAFSDPLIKFSLFEYPNFSALLKQLVLTDPDPAVRREACSGFHRMCLGTTSSRKTGHIFIPKMLNSLLNFLPEAQAMNSSKLTDIDLNSFGEREPYGPGCQDYFWLVCQLVDSLEGESRSEMIDELNNLCFYMADAIKNRETQEDRFNKADDDGLRGLLCLMTVTLKQNPPFKHSEEGNQFLTSVFVLLFATPNHSNKSLPKCKSHSIRLSAFELLVELAKGCERNLLTLLELLFEQHKPSAHSQYPWDYWPHDGCRSECGYVGLLNLGATCYMASCVQHLFMFPRVRNAILSANETEDTKHGEILQELKRMFANLLESERKAYNPKGFCKVYTMNNQPLNTGEQKDMTEFFTDLISKLEEMSPKLKDTVKSLFAGTLSNNVVSLDCPHISRTKEEFYTLRCKVADMKHIWDSLNELTVKDTLEGDNMYTCGECEKKVRAEKRVCIEKLPRILSFNTMRYTYNMPAQTKEKVNTYFSFPLRLDMSAYLQENLMPDTVENNHKTDDESESNEFELVGVTVHTGNADGGHYYCFIREPDKSKGSDKWYMFNDAEVKPFDPNQIAAECFGGEMTSKTYDSVNDKYMDFSIEKTNSAYMLFYERLPKNQHQSDENIDKSDEFNLERDLDAEILRSIWEDNINFLRDKNIFEPSYFTFMWQVCGFISQTLTSMEKVLLPTTQLATSFVLETFIHSREKPMIANWVELLTKLYSSNQEACEWLINTLAKDYLNWPVQILLKCPNHMVRQLFQQLVVHVIVHLRNSQQEIYIKALESDIEEDLCDSKGYCVTRFVRKLLSLIECNNNANSVKPHLKHLTGYFSFLCEFSKLGHEESNFLLRINAITIVVQFYLSHSKGAGDCIEILSDEDEEDEEEISPNIFFQGFRGANPMAQMGLPDKYPKPVSLDKMITFVSNLIEKSRKPNNELGLSGTDLESVIGGKSLPFLQRQIRDNINLRQSFTLICSLCKYDDNAANSIVNMLLHSINRQPETSQPFFRILSMLVELSTEIPGMPNFCNLIYPRIWEIAEQNPHHCLEWLTAQVPRNKNAHSLVLSNLKSWIETFLLAHNNQRVRNAAALLIISLVPNNLFRQSYFKSPRNLMMQNKDSLELSNEAIQIIRQIFTCLLQQLKNAKNFVDHTNHSKLTSFFAVMAYCLVSREEKLMLVPYFNDLWDLFQPKLSEPAVAINQNKQSMLYFWHQACIDCPENIKCIISNPHVTKNIAFNYILADHEDQDVILFNRMMLPSYYGLLRLCCAQSRAFTRQLALHQNIQWAFKNITPYFTQYQAAVSELFKLMKLFVTVYIDSTEQELKDVKTFKKNTLQMYLTSMDSRSCWTTLITALSILMESEDDKEFVILNNGIIALVHSFSTLFLMFHEATACHVTNEIVELLKILANLLQTLRTSHHPEVREWAQKWEDHLELIRKLILLMNTFTPPEVRSSCMTVLLEIVKLYSKECIPMVVQTLGLGHLTFQDQLLNFSPGPYFPRRGQRTILSKSSLRPPRPVFQMHFHPKMLEISLSVDEDYDKAIFEYFFPYYKFVCDLCKIAVSNSIVNSELVGLCSMVAIEALLMNITLFPEMWLEFSQSSEDSGQEFFNLLCSSSNYFRDYICMILTGDRNFLNEDAVYEILKRGLPKVYILVTNQHFKVRVLSIISSLWDRLEKVDILKNGKNLVGDFRVLISLISCVPAAPLISEIKTPLIKLREKCIGLVSPGEALIEQENPQKKRKTKENPTAEDENTDMLTDEMEVMKSRLENTILEFTKALDGS